MCSSAWLGSATPLGWVAEGEGDCDSISLQSFLDDFARVHGCTVDSPAEEFYEVDDPVAVVD